MREQVEWLKARIAELQLPSGKRDHDTREKWLLECGMPESEEPAPRSQLLETINDVLINHCGHEGGEPVVDYFQLRDQLLTALAPAPEPHVVGIIAAFEQSYPELYWHVAKGKITAGEPLYGAIITTIFGAEIGHGESDVSADDSFRIAIEDASLCVSAPAPATFSFVADCLRNYAEIIRSGQIDNAGHYIPEDVEESADQLEASQQTNVDAPHGWVCFNSGPTEWFWSENLEALEHELSYCIRPATHLEKYFFNKQGKQTHQHPSPQTRLRGSQK